MDCKLRILCKKVFIYSGILLLFLSSCSSFHYEEELVEAYYNLGNAYSDLGMLDDSASVFIRALQIDPSFPSAAYNLGIVHIQSGAYQQGIDVLTDLLKTNPENTVVMKILAWGYFKKGDIHKAIEVYNSILGIDSYNMDVLNNITILMIKDSMYKEAYPLLVRLESIEDANSNTLYNLGIAERELSLSSGALWFKSAYKKDKSVKEYLVALIDALKIEHSYSSVVEYYDALLEIDPDPVLFFDKAFILLTAIEDYSLGIPALEKAMEGGFSDLERIDELKSYPDLLDRDRILSVFISYPIQSPTIPEQSPAIPEQSPAIPEQSPAIPEQE